MPRYVVELARNQTMEVTVDTENAVDAADIALVQANDPEGDYVVSLVYLAGPEE
jgi:hydrogenase maturation factor